MVAWKSGTSFNEIQTVLIISQDLEMMNVWGALFEEKNCRVVSEVNAKTALQTSRLLSPALIVLDLDLSHFERVNLCREIRSTTSGTLIVLAPKRSDAEIYEYLYAGADEFLPAPVSPMALLIKSMAWLARHEWAVPRAHSDHLYV